MDFQAASLMMVTYNRLPLTQQTLALQIASIGFKPMQLIIVDNGSTDGTPEFLKDLGIQLAIKFPDLDYQVILNSENKGIAKARNQALEAATNDWLVTIDNDVACPDHWLSDCIEFLAVNKDFGALGVNFERENFELKQFNGKICQFKARGNLGTACMVFHRRVQKMLGYFNTEYGLYGEEDADWGARIRVCKLKLGYLPTNGQHLGEGEYDIGPYREFKTKSHQDNLIKFNQNCRDYYQGRKSIFLPCRT